MQRVRLADQGYILREESKLTKGFVQQLSNPFRTTGTQQRSDNSKINKIVYGWSQGIFWQSMRRNPPDGASRGINGLRDADAETQFDELTLPLNPQAVSADLYGADGEHFQGGYAKFLNGLWLAIHQANSASLPGEAGAVKYGATSDDLTAGNQDVVGTVPNPAPREDGDHCRAYAITSHKGQLFLLYGLGDDDGNTERHYIAKSVDGVTWTDARGTPDAPFTTDLLTTASLGGNDWRDQLGAMIGFGDKLVIAVRELAASDAGTVDQFLFYSSASATGTPGWDADTTIPSSINQIKMHVWRDHVTSGAPAIPVAVLNEGIYSIDTVGETFSTIHTLGGAPGDGLASAVAKADGRLYVGTADGNIIALGIEGVGALTYEDIGPASYGDGPVSTRQGYATYIYGDDPTGLWVAYGGSAAGKFASIFFYRFRDRTWHSKYLDTTANREITQLTLSTADDGGMRLHFNTEGATDDVPQMIENPHVGSRSGLTQQYRSSGIAEAPDDDLGDPHSDTLIITSRADADDLDTVATIEAGDGTNTVHVEQEYGVDGAAWTSVSNLGNFGSDDKVLFFGKTDQNTPSATEAGTPIGVLAKRLRLRWKLFRDATTTKSPKVKELQVEAQTQNLDLRWWEFTVDIEATAIDSLRDPEQVIADLDTLAKPGQLKEFEIGKSGVAYVEVKLPPEFSLDVESSGDGYAVGGLTGIVRLRVEEVSPA